jgi:protein-S-isoprenylcysteine O-methyltransferase Ste14
MMQSLKYILAVLDAVPVMIVLFFSIREGVQSVLIVLYLAILMFVWHFAENNILKPRYVKEAVAVYAGKQVWPTIAFSLVIVASAIERSICYLSHEMNTCSVAWIDSYISGLAGCTIASIGVLLRILSFITIKEEFIREPGDNKQYIREGPYRIMRHPAYYGLFWIGIGAALCLQSLWGLVVAVVTLLSAVQYVIWIEHSRWNRAC